MKMTGRSSWNLNSYPFVPFACWASLKNHVTWSVCSLCTLQSLLRMILTHSMKHGLKTKSILLACFLTSALLVVWAYNRVSYCLGYGWTQEVAPKSLSVWSQRGLLDQRGVAYHHVFEKAELEKLVTASGRVTALDVASLQQTAANSSATVFTTAYDYKNRVELCTDGAWLVMIVQQSKDKGKIFPLNQEAWAALEKRVSNFEIRTGIIDCFVNNAKTLCQKPQRQSSSFELSLPRYGSKISQIFSYSGPSNPQKIYDWLQKMLRRDIVTIGTTQELLQGWLTTGNSPYSREKHVVFITDRRGPMPFFTALSVHFTGSAKMAWLQIGDTGREKLLEALRGSKPFWPIVVLLKALGFGTALPLPLVLVANSEGTYVYGQAADECFTYHCLKQFLSHFDPDQNTALSVSFIASVLLAFGESFVNGSWQVSTVLRKIVVNIVVTALSWLFSSFEEYFLVQFLNFLVLKVTRFLATTWFGAAVRGAFSLLSQNIFLLIASILLAAYLASVLNKATGVFCTESEERRSGQTTDAQAVREGRDAGLNERRQHQVNSNRIRQIIGSRNVVSLQPDADEDNRRRQVNSRQTTGSGNVSLQPAVDDEEDPLDYGLPGLDWDDMMLITQDVHARTAFVQSRSRTDLQELRRQILTVLHRNQSTPRELGRQILTDLNRNQSTPHHRLEDLPSWPFQDNGGSSESDSESPTCVICQDQYVEGDTMTCLPCTHVFHYQCLANWITRGNCPLCRN